MILLVTEPVLQHIDSVHWLMMLYTALPASLAAATDDAHAATDVD